MILTPLLNGVKIKSGTVWPMTKTVTRSKGIPETYLPKSAVLKMFDVSERTLKRDKKNGTIQTIKDERGWNWFDPSSLTLKYAGRSQDDTGPEKSQTVSLTPVGPPSDTPQTVSMLRHKVEILEATLQAIEQERDDLRSQRENAEDREKDLRALIKQQQETINNQTLLLLPPDDKRRASLWQRYVMAIQCFFGSPK